MYYELCGNCDNETLLEEKFEIQKCNTCGHRIYPCGLCEPDTMVCSKCPIERDILYKQMGWEL